MLHTPSQRLPMFRLDYCGHQSAIWALSIHRTVTSFYQTSRCVIVGVPAAYICWCSRFSLCLTAIESLSYEGRWREAGWQTVITHVVSSGSRSQLRWDVPNICHHITVISSRPKIILKPQSPYHLYRNNHVHPSSKTQTPLYPIINLPTNHLSFAQKHNKTTIQHQTKYLWQYQHSPSPAPHWTDKQTHR